MKQLTAFEAPALKANLVPIEVLNERGPSMLNLWNQRVRRWHRKGGRP